MHPQPTVVGVHPVFERTGTVFLGPRSPTGGGGTGSPGKGAGSPARGCSPGSWTTSERR